jgi:hypothetical protein
LCRGGGDEAVQQKQNAQRGSSEELAKVHILLCPFREWREMPETGSRIEPVPRHRYIVTEGHYTSNCRKAVR